MSLRSIRCAGKSSLCDISLLGARCTLVWIHGLLQADEEEANCEMQKRGALHVDLRVNLSCMEPDFALQSGYSCRAAVIYP
jgi:hypothetical protein